MKFRFCPFRKKKKSVHGTNAEDRQLIIGEDTPFAVKEAYRTTCTNLLYLPIIDRCKKIAITSAMPGEGKTTVSINLAVTLAQSSTEHRVLLIDADLRKPRIARLLEENGQIHGLSEYLAGIDEEPNIRASAVPGLSVLYSGKTTTNPAALLASERMEMLMKYCEDKFEYIIIDTSPVNTVSDALLMKKNVNGYLLVARAGFSDVNSMNDAVESMRMLEASVYGIILDSFDPKSGKGRGYTKYSGGRYSSYDTYSYDTSTAQE
ncbi:MAG TPA: hypothetical protein DDY70_01960 [Clostridiales bacterium]|nr:hypothetical protein [Clostridiales bacterium]